MYPMPHASPRLDSLLALLLLVGCPSGDENETATSDDPTMASDTDPTTTGGPMSDTDPDPTTGSPPDTDTDSDSATDTDDSDTDATTSTGTGEPGECGMPAELGVVDLDDLDIDGFHVLGDRIALALRGDGVGLLDISDPANATLLGSYDTSGEPTYRVATDGTYIVGGRRGGGAYLVDATDPANMMELWLDDTLDGQDVLLDGTTLFLAGSASLSVVDVSTPASPVVLVDDAANDGADGNFAGGNVAIDGSTLFMANQSLTAIDVTELSAPVNIGELDDMGRPENITIVNSLAFVGGADGVAVIDVSEPAAPDEIGFLGAPRSTHVAVDIDNDHLFVLGDDTASTDVPFLRIADIGDPSTPIVVGEMYDELDDPEWIQFADGNLYFTTESTNPSTLYILDACPEA